MSSVFLSVLMLLEHLYLISLERPEHWALFIGLPVNSMILKEVRVDQLQSYILGLLEASRLAKVETNGIDSFFNWLIDTKKEFPTEGWSTKYFNDCDGEHLLAISKFWSFLHEYILLKKLDWFIKLNSKPLPSKLRNGVGTPNREDIRFPEHIKAISF